MSIDYKESISDVFDSEHEEKAIALFKQHKDATVEEALAEFKQILSDAGITEDEFLCMSLADKKFAGQDAKVNRLMNIWRNNGVGRGGRKYTYDDMANYDIRQSEELMEDTQFSTDQPLLIPKVISQFVREAIEPRMVLTDLLQKVRFSGGRHITFPATSGFYAADIPEGGEYPERRLEFAGEVVAAIGKSGVAVKMTEEMIRYSQFDIMAMHLREAGKALIRHKERKAADSITAAGDTVFDNDGGTPTTGRGIDGTANGSFTLDDLLTMWAAAANEGWQPDALLMNPIGWLIFARDPVMRAFGFANGGALWQPLEGQVGAAPQWKQGGFNILGSTSAVANPRELATTQVGVPSQFPFGPLKIIVSPFIGYDAANNATDIHLVDTSQLGYLIEDEAVTTEEFSDPARDIHKVKFRERYAITGTQDNRGKIARNVVITKGYDLDDLVRWQAGTGDLPAISFTL